uniref:glycosyltransferase family 2 protein n=1 Tax=Algoriphagus sp. TaxID=1872435 RepID=UPI004047FA79
MINSIFKEYFSSQNFSDKYLHDESNAVDVIIPVFHTNELWKTNLFSIYKEIPVRRLLISDGGVIDDSVDVVKEFPRVEVYDHRKYKTLGKCISELIKSVTSDWFVYLHSDVYLPNGWFDSMIKHQDKYDWYGCPMNITVLVNYRLDEPRRPYAGSQLGRREAFKKVDIVDDDFVYRQEDFVFNKIVEEAGYRTGKVEDTFHYHQVMFRQSKGYDLNVKSVSIETNTNKEEILRNKEMQLRGVVKYLNPDDDWSITEFKTYSTLMLQEGLIEFNSFKKWIKITNPKWLDFFNHKFLIKFYFFKMYRRLKYLIKL